ncbi:hypothetical protein [Vreelandella malpeensis]|uniref:CheW-like domain-containing protein n=1 Tax=Vreelandella malpeensis TaxID=1172368 RepID=A0ABS8DQV9_9GAMM|nr:hypothetical protein [Halomonas malpeensis]MCB8888260.1 hypothetical protein [Halomonas malpeensis]
MDHVSLVVFEAGQHRFALEASRVRRLSSTPSHTRTAHLARLLNLEGSAPASRWLTLVDGEGAWELGVAGSTKLIDWPAPALYPLSELVLVRASVHPALIGIAFERQHTPCWLLAADRLTP